jgi:ribonuclease VapC
MIVDSSAIIAVLRDEPDAASFAKAIARATKRRISAVNYVEAAAAIDGSKDPIASRRFDDFLREAEIEIAAVTATQAKIAREAYRDFGKSSGHRAKLNLGDCFTYALARESGEPVLFKGTDFAETDLAAALE